MDNLFIFDLLLIVKIMGLELLLGTISGFTLKLLERRKVAYDSSLEVFSATEYSSQNFGRSLPPNAFDAFSPYPEFVVVTTLDDNLTKEKFIGFFGSYTQAIYENGNYVRHEFSALTSPIYLSVVFIPIIVGFSSLFFPFRTNSLVSVLYSGIIWMVTTTLMLWGREIVKAIIQAMKEQDGDSRA